MSRFEVRSADNSVSVRVTADDELQAAELSGLEDAYVYPVDETTPIGFVGGDAEDAIAAGESIDHGDVG